MPIAHLWHATSQQQHVCPTHWDKNAMCHSDPGIRGGWQQQNDDKPGNTHDQPTASSQQHKPATQATQATVATVRAAPKLTKKKEAKKTDIPTLSPAREKVKSARIDLVGSLSRSLRLRLRLWLLCSIRFEWAAKKLVYPSGEEVLP